MHPSKRPAENRELRVNSEGDLGSCRDRRHRSQSQVQLPR